MAVALTVNVFCQKDWSRNPVYRVYVNDDLLTERTWVWPAYDFFIKENIEVDIKPGTHRIVVQTVSPDTDNIVFRDLTVNGILVPETVRDNIQEYQFNIV